VTRTPQIATACGPFWPEMRLKNTASHEAFPCAACTRLEMVTGEKDGIALESGPGPVAIRAGSQKRARP